MAAPHHRHQSSLESIIDFTDGPPLRTEQRARGQHRFQQLVNHFETVEASTSSLAKYKHAVLVRLTYHYAQSETSRDNFFRAFFEDMEMPMDDEGDIDWTDGEVEARLHTSLIGFADYLVNNFFLPLKAGSSKTPQPSPAFSAAVERTQGGVLSNFVGTPDRLSGLRGACLVRDHRRCVISRAFEQLEAIARINLYGDGALDDDGQLLLPPGENNSQFAILEVAHILPHSLTQNDLGSTQLSPAKKAALAILNLFDHGIVHLIDGEQIDRPRNALTLTQELHYHFGQFNIFFTPVPDQPPNTYCVESFVPSSLLRFAPPVTRTLLLTETRTIEPPSPRLLAVHRAIAQILRLSAAGQYIDNIFRDAENYGILSDGSTELDRLVKLRLDGWLDRAVRTY